jgi:truncated hemoglobin YjbI
MCSGLLHFLDHHQVGRAKYDEQLTMKWIRLIHEAIEQIDPDSSIVEITNGVIERFADLRVGRTSS